MTVDGLFERLDPWLQPVAVRRLAAALRVTAPVATIGVMGGAAPAWVAEVDGCQALVADGGERFDAAVVASPDSLPEDPDDEVDFVERLTSRAGIVLLATVSPATAVDAPGRWPAYWAGRFRPAGWRFVDVRPALWDDPQLSPDVKEGALVFSAPGVAHRPGGSAPVAMVHPHRLVTMLRVAEAQMDRWRAEVEERDRAAVTELSAAVELARVERRVLESRLAVAERRVGLLTEQLLLRPPPSAGPRSWWNRRRRQRHRARAGVSVARQLDPVMVALFDPAYYCSHSPEASGAPLAHYLDVGEDEGRRPNPYFDPAFYRRAHPDVAESGMGLLEHYARFGGSEGRAPSEEFDTAWYRAAHTEVRISGLHPLLHFLAVGESMGLPPRLRSDGDTPIGPLDAG